jgi:hypothetical protein
MNYQKIYNQIIKCAKNRQLEGYVEKHHIIPKCLGGNNNKNNIVQLTAREHFLCHMLLCEIYSDNKSLKYALYLMNIGKQKHKEADYRISSRTYERLKLEHALFLTGKKQKDKTKQKKSKSMKQVWANKTDKEIKQYGEKVWKTRIKNGTNTITKKQAENISKALKNRKMPWRTKSVSQYDLKGNWIRDWESQAEIKKHSDYGDVGGCLKYNQKTAYGYIWKFKENQLS